MRITCFHLLKRPEQRAIWLGERLRQQRWAHIHLRRWSYAQSRLWSQTPLYHDLSVETPTPRQSNVSVNQQTGPDASSKPATTKTINGPSLSEPIKPRAVASSPLGELEERRLLARARHHGINSLDELHREIGTNFSEGWPSINTLMLDRDRETRQDLDLWIFLLDAARQLSGRAGILKLYHILGSRGLPLHLPSTNPNSRDIIDAFLYAGIHRSRSIERLKSMCSFFISHCYCEDLIFMGVVGGLLRSGQTRRARLMAAWLKGSGHFDAPRDMGHVFRAACESENLAALKACSDINNDLTDDKIYSETVSYLWETNRPSAAFEWHKQRIGYGDLPTTFDMLLPFIAHIALTGDVIQNFINHLSAKGVRYNFRILDAHYRAVAFLANNPEASRNSIVQYLRSEVSASSHDEMIARALAIGSFSFDFVLNSLVFLGVVEFGPLAVRQMVVSAPDLKTLNSQFDKLQDRGVDTGSHIFVAIIQQLRQTRDFDMLKRIASSDMHHDEFAKVDLQKELVGLYQLTKDVDGLSRSLLILNSGRARIIDRDYTNNLLFVNAINRRDWGRVLEIAVSLHQTGLLINPRVLTYFVSKCLETSVASDRSLQKLRYPTPFDMITYMIGVCQQIVTSGSYVEVEFWRRPLVALAQHNRIGATHRLLTWIMRLYATDNVLRKSYVDLNLLLTPIFHKALIAWDFQRFWRQTLLSNPRRPMDNLPHPPITLETAPWLHAARLLRQWHDNPSLGIKIDYLALEEEFLFRLLEMHSNTIPGLTSSNKRWARYRGVTLQDMAEGWYRVWHDSGADVDLDRILNSTLQIQRNQIQHKKWISMRDRRTWLQKRYSPTSSTSDQPDFSRYSYNKGLNPGRRLSECV